MKLRSLLPNAVSLLLIVCALASVAQAGSRPRFGGTLRIQVHDAVYSYNPSAGELNTLAAQQIALAVYDRLTEVDAAGNVRPSLAVSWSSDADQRIWQFKLRGDAIFPDGSRLTPQIAAESLASPLWKVISSSSGTLTFELKAAGVDLPALLSLPRYSIVRHDEEGKVSGTGPFQVKEWLAGQRALLVANVDHWAGRPFLDSVEFLMAGSIRAQLIDRRLQREEALEVPFDQIRGIASSQKVSISTSAFLYALVFPNSGKSSAVRKHTQDGKVRQAIAATIDRASVESGILQRQTQTSAALLPNSLTGYAFLMDTPPDLPRAKLLRADAAFTAALPLAYEATDATAKIIAERVAINAREAGINITPYPETRVSATAITNAEILLVKIPVASGDPAAALFDLATSLRLTSELPRQSPEERFQQERVLLEDHRVIPIAHLPSGMWLNQNVRNWISGPQWRLEQVWLEKPQP